MKADCLSGVTQNRIVQRKSSSPRSLEEHRCHLSRVVRSRHQRPSGPDLSRQQALRSADCRHRSQHGQGRTALRHGGTQGNAGGDDHWFGQRDRGYLLGAVGRLFIQKNANAVLRGIRAVSDYEFELQMALMNRKMEPRVETVFMMPAEKYSYLSSRIVREIAKLSGPLTGLVPEPVEERVR